MPVNGISDTLHVSLELHYVTTNYLNLKDTCSEILLLMYCKRSVVFVSCTITKESSTANTKILCA